MVDRVAEATRIATKQKDPAEFERIWRQYRPRIWRLAARLAGGTDQADDLTQEVSLRAFQAFDGLRNKSQAFTWLYRIAVNVVLRERERRKAVLSLEQTEVANLLADAEAGPEEAALRADLWPRVQAALERLPEEMRTTLILQVYEGLTYREIAAILDIPMGTVMSRLHSARQLLRKELEDYVS